MSIVLQISDPHFGTERAQVLEALAALATQLRPDLVILSGDLTQRAQARQFAAARRFVDRLKTPWLAVPGNHDIPLFDLARRLLQPYARYQQAFGPNIEPTHQSADLLVLGVNTTRAWRHKHGEVSSAQIERVATRLTAATADQLRVVVVHHPVVVPEAGENDNLLRGHQAASRRWTDAGADLVMAGHIHWPFIDRLPGSRRAWAVNAGTATSKRVRSDLPNSVNVVRWGQHAPSGQCQIERWDHPEAGTGFVCVKRHGLRPQRLDQADER